MSDLTETIAELRRLHAVTCEHDGDTCQQLPDCTLAVCAECGDTWPCATNTLFDELATARAENTRLLRMLHADVARAERAEAALARVRALVDDWDKPDGWLRNVVAVPSLSVVRSLRAALDPNGTGR